MIIDKDIKKLKTIFATKDDLKKFATKDDLACSLKTLNNTILKFKDEILGEIEKIREDYIMYTGLWDQVEDHEIRIEKVENHVKITPSS